MTSRTLRQGLEEVFDFRLVETIVKYVEEPKSWESDLGHARVESESRLPTTRTGLTMLLGKNGAGKSRFLGALRRFSAFEGGDPHVVFRFAIPSVEEHLEYLDVVEGLKRRPEYVDEVAQLETFEIGAVDLRDFGLRFHDLLIESFTVPAYEAGKGFEAIFGISSSSELLEHFGFPDVEVDAFRRRQSEFHMQAEPHFPRVLRGNLNFRDYFPEFFLFMLHGSTFSRGVDLGPGTWFDCSQLIADRASRIALVREIRWCFENAKFLEVRNVDGEHQFSLIGDSEASDEVARSAEFRRTSAQDYDNVTFPFDLMRTDQSHSTAFRTLLGEVEFSEWSPFGIVDLTFQSRERAVQDIRTLFHRFVSVSVEPADGPDFVITTHTDSRSASVLARSGALLLESDIGVTELRIRGMESRPTATAPRGEFGWRWRPRSVDFVPVIDWRGPGDDEWRSLEECSDGQLDVVRIIVHLVAFTSNEHDHHVNMLLIDEFNRHLHPTVSQVLLNQLDRYGRRSGTRVIASTHSFGSLEIHRYPQILAERDDLGRHRLTIGESGDKLALAAKLGVPQRLVTELKKLIVLVEGDHDEAVLDVLFGSNPEVAVAVELVNLYGLYGLSSQWRSWLRHETADVVLVYDKRNKIVEDAWIDLLDHARKARVKENLLARKPAIQDELHSCIQRIKLARKREEPVAAGDTETRYICNFLCEVVDVAQESADVGAIAATMSRVHLHGLAVPDIVDLLPVSDFENTGRFGSWEALRSHPSNADLGADAFKLKFGIKGERVRHVASRSMQHGVHPELQGLFARIVGILETSEFDQDPRRDDR